MAFTLVINLAIGIIGYIGNGSFGYEAQEYNPDLAQNDILDLESSIGGAPVEDTQNWGDKILDFFTLGLYSKAKSFGKNLLFGFTNFLKNARIIDNGLFILLNTFLTIIYVAGIYELFTGKNILGG
jgi:hypothetical protein